jgi:hypothetical protein
VTLKDWHHQVAQFYFDPVFDEVVNVARNGASCLIRPARPPPAPHGSPRFDTRSRSATDGDALDFRPCNFGVSDRSRATSHRLFLARTLGPPEQREWSCILHRPQANKENLSPLSARRRRRVSLGEPRWRRCDFDGLALSETPIYICGPALLRCQIRQVTIGHSDGRGTAGTSGESPPPPFEACYYPAREECGLIK